MPREEARDIIEDLREQIAKVRKDRDAIIEDVTNDRDEWLQSSRDWRIRAEKAEERERALRAERDRLRKAGDELVNRAHQVLLAPNDGLLVAARGHLMNIAIPAWREAVGGGEVEDAG